MLGGIFNYFCKIVKKKIEVETGRGAEGVQKSGHLSCKGNCWDHVVLNHTIHV